MLKRQPLYIVGVDHPSVAAEKCMGAAWTYFFIVVLSVGTLIYDKARPKAVSTGENYGMMRGDMDFLGSNATAERDQRRAARSRAPGAPRPSRAKTAAPHPFPLRRAERDSLAGLEMQSMRMV